MYTENYDYDDRKKEGFPLKDFLLKLILIIILVLLLMWLIPWPNNKSLTDRIFNDNVQEMKNASLLYFTQERLPVNVGDKKTLTLQEMLDLKLLLPFTDKDGKACSTTESYVTIEKLEVEYLLKVFLKCDGQEDYILVHVGCYAYCTTYLCEDKTKPTPTPIQTKTPKPTKTPTPTKTPCPTCPTPTMTPPPTPTVTPPPGKEYIYEYKKDFAGQCTLWGNWTEHIMSNSESVPTSTDKYQAEYLGQFNVQIGNKIITSYVAQQKQVQVGSVSYTACSSFTYTVHASTYYRIASGWRDNGIVHYGKTTIPVDTISKRYVPIRLRYDLCASECVNHPIYDYKEQVRDVVKVTEGESVTVGCGSWVTKTIPIMGPKTEYTKLTATVPVYGNIRKYRDRTCTTYRDPYSDLKWSFYNDQSLLAQKYYMTGKYKEK